MYKYILSSVLLVSSAFAELQSFEQSNFDQSLKNGQQTILMVNTPWCGHCMRQRSVIASLEETKPYNTYAFYKLPRSGENELKASLTKQYITPFLQNQQDKKTCDLSTRSTLVVFHKVQVVACEAFLTNKDKIKTLISQGN